MSEEKLTQPHLRLAGWLSIVSAITTIPLFGLSLVAFMPGGGQSMTLGLFSTLMAILHAGIVAYVLLTFRDYLIIHGKFHDAEKLLNILVGLTIASAVIQAVVFIFENIAVFSSLLSFALLIPFGVVSIMLGLRLLQLRDTLFGLHSAVSYLFIFVGVTVASIVLLLPGIILGIILDVLLGVLLIQASTTHGRKV